MKSTFFIAGVLFTLVYTGCSKKTTEDPPAPPPPANFKLSGWSVDQISTGNVIYNVSKAPVIKFRCGAPVDRASVASGIHFLESAGTPVSFNAAYENADSVVVVKPASALSNLNRYRVGVTNSLKSAAGGNITNATELSFITSIDSSRKFPAITDEALLDSVQRRTFKYFWDLAHPGSGMIRERNTDPGIYTSGGTGFGIMAIVTAIHRGFITRAQGLERLQNMVAFLKNTAETFHGAYPHWLNGETGKVIPFSANDNGADIVETSFLIQGLLVARQYFNGVDIAETNLRSDINTIADRVEWDWFRKNDENALYWHWSSTNANGWIMNLKIKGWNECLITYVLAASSKTHAVPKVVYDEGWASNGGMKNGKNYYGYQLPLGPEMGGPLFFSHYSFLGIDPTSLTDTYANYSTQTENHTLINYNYCKTNPGNYFGYSDSVWGLTASDIKDGYHASSPTSDRGYIAPTAALSSFPYTPGESMQALKFYYYVLGDKIWKEYGFVDAFSLHHLWFANTYLAIDQGPIIVMIENYRSGLIWDLFTSCPEVKDGMKTLGFSAGYL
ncbi:MAG TPA: glucoamylase family protein [Chitinophagaceae bacterium]|nr:glucoamylase family protein [Chitinophagaceae bacterium]